MKYRILLLLVVFATGIFSGIQVKGQDAEMVEEAIDDTMAQETELAESEGPGEEALAMGKELFTKYCKSCHAVTTRLTGPPLKGIEERRERAWIYEFVRNSTDVIKSGDEYAVKLFKEYNETLMTSYPDLKDQEIDLILDYVKSEELLAAQAPKFKRPVKVDKAYLPITIDNHWAWLMITFFLVIIVLGTYFVISMGIKINNS